jgi:hypothetical protein
MEFQTLFLLQRVGSKYHLDKGNALARSRKNWWPLDVRFWQDPTFEVQLRISGNITIRGTDHSKSYVRFGEADQDP